MSNFKEKVITSTKAAEELARLLMENPQLFPALLNPGTNKIVIELQSTCDAYLDGRADTEKMGQLIADTARMVNEVRTMLDLMEKYNSVVIRLIGENEPLSPPEDAQESVNVRPN